MNNKRIHGYVPFYYFSDSVKYIITYDMAFATFIVDNMRKQNMLKDEKIAELLKDNPDER